MNAYTTTYRGYTREELEQLRDELGRDEVLGQIAHWSDAALADRLDRRAAARAAWAKEVAAAGGQFAAVRARAAAHRAGGAR